MDVLKDFTRFGRILVPRFVFYGMLFTVYLGLVTVQSYASDPIVGWFAVLLAAASAVFWYEAIRAWRTVP